jgi:uncharacterized Tic20 family protein
MDIETISPVTQDSKNIAVLTWIGTLFFYFIPSLIVYLLKKDDAYVQTQAKEALNWCITTAIAYAICFVLAFVLIGFVGFVALGLCHLVCCIMGAVACSNGKDFVLPFAIRLIK